MKQLSSSFLNARQGRYYGESFYMALTPKNGGYITFDSAHSDIFPTVFSSFSPNQLAVKIITYSDTMPTVGAFNMYGCCAYLPSADKHVIIGDNGTYITALASGDSGATWTTVTSSLSTAIYGASFPLAVETDGSKLYMVYNGGAVVSFDGTAFATLGTVTTPGSVSKLRYRSGTFYYFSSDQSTTSVWASSPDCITWTYATDPTVLLAGSLDITASGKVAFAKYGFPKSTLYVSETTTLNGPWTAKPIPYSANTSVTWVQDEMLIISNLGLVTTDLGTSFNAPNSLAANYTANVANGSNICGVMVKTQKYIMTALSGLKLTSQKLIAVSSAELTALFADVRATVTTYWHVIDINKFAISAAGTSINGAPITRFAIIEIVEGKPTVTTDYNSINFNSARGRKHIVTANVNPLREVGCFLDYAPDDTFKICNGSSAYADADIRLKQLYPTVTRSYAAVPPGGYDGGTALYANINSLSYANSTLIAFVKIYKFSVFPFLAISGMIYSFDGGASWNQGTSIDHAAYLGGSISNIDFDGTYYYVGTTDGTGNYVQRLTTLTGAYTLTAGWPSGEIASYIYCLASNSTMAISYATGSIKVYQTTNQGTTFSQVATIGSGTSVSRVIKIGGTWYISTNAGIFSTTNFTAFTQVSSTTQPYASLAYLNGTWVAVRSGLSVIEHSTDSMATWTIKSTQTSIPSIFAANAIIGTIGNYFVSDSGLISSDGVNFYPMSTVSTGLTGTTAQLSMVDAGGTQIFWSSTDSSSWSAPWSATVNTDLMTMPFLPGTYMKIHA